MAPGLNLNHPLPAGTGDVAYVAAFGTCLEAALSQAPRALVISLGFDALASDPARGLQLTVEAFRAIGEILGSLNLPVLLVQEGGYDLTNLEKAATAFLFALAQPSNDPVGS